jgi:hypothetical protein
LRAHLGGQPRVRLEQLVVALALDEIAQEEHAHRREVTKLLANRPRVHEQRVFGEVGHLVQPFRAHRAAIHGRVRRSQHDHSAQPAEEEPVDRGGETMLGREQAAHARAAMQVDDRVVQPREAEQIDQQVSGIAGARLGDREVDDVGIPTSPPHLAEHARHLHEAPHGVRAVAERRFAEVDDADVVPRA